MTFDFDKETTRVVCRGCAHKYKDSYFADIDGGCADCDVIVSHGCFTNMDKITAKTENHSQTEPSSEEKVSASLSKSDSAPKGGKGK